MSESTRLRRRQLRRQNQDSALVPMAGSEAVPNVHVDEVYLPVTDGVARCQLYRPAAAPADQHLPVIVYYHGGGFTVGSSDDCDFLSRKLAFTNNAVVVSANYRMAPEFPFPTPFDDAYDVYSWVVDNTHEIDADSARIAVAGDSAGSALAAVPLRARDEGMRLPDAVVLLGAFTDFQYERWESFRELAPHGIVYDTAFMGFIRGAHPSNTPWNHPWASPIAGDVNGYPIAFVAAGTHDPLVDSARAFAQKVRDAGGTAVGHFPAGMPHGLLLSERVSPGGHRLPANRHNAGRGVRPPARPLGRLRKAIVVAVSHTVAPRLRGRGDVGADPVLRAGQHSRK